MKKYETYAAIIYVTETEKQAVIRMFDWSPLRIDGDTQEYMEAFILKNDKRLRIICAQQDEMGMTASATLTMKMIQQFVPKYVIMPGIAAGAGNLTSSRSRVRRRAFGGVGMEFFKRQIRFAAPGGNSFRRNRF